MSADPRFVAADMLSQAEHGPDSEAILVTTRCEVAASVVREIAVQVESLSRRDTIIRSLSEHGLIIIADDLDQAVDVVNRYAPEHLEVMVDDPHALLSRLRNAGSILLGPLTPVAATDYAAGPNHVLPTGGTARSGSPLSVRDFVKIQNITSLTRVALDDMMDAAETIAAVEGLDAHAAALGARRVGL
jgi:histidinol dehydrogenase